MNLRRSLLCYRVLLIALLAIFSTSSYAQEVFETHNFILRHNDVDMVNRNQRFGEFTVADITFKKWLTVPESLANIDTDIGISKAGEVIQIVTLKTADGVERKIARRLSGNKKFEDLVITDDGLLIARDAENRLYAFDNRYWLKSPMLKLFVKGLSVWTVTTATVAMGALVAYELIPAEPNHMLFALITGTSAFASGLSTALASAIRFDDLNQHTNGFINTGKRIESGRESMALQVQGMLASGYFSKFNSDLTVGCANSFLPRPGNGAHFNRTSI
jgi:hypothetical protein